MKTKLINFTDPYDVDLRPKLTHAKHYTAK